MCAMLCCLWQQPRFSCKRVGYRSGGFRLFSSWLLLIIIHSLFIFLPKASNAKMHRYSSSSLATVQVSTPSGGSGTNSPYGTLFSGVYCPRDIVVTGGSLCQFPTSRMEWTHTNNDATGLACAYHVAEANPVASLFVLVHSIREVGN